MTKRRKRAPGGGRKPKGETSQLREQLSLRMPTDMRRQLEAARRESGRSFTQELLTRLRRSLDEDRKNYRDPATKALCFLFSELADYIHHGTPDWRSDPFLFKSFKLGVAKLLDNLPEPAGKLETPPLLRTMHKQYSTDDPMNQTEFFRNERESIARRMKSPEALAEFAVERTLAGYFKTDPRYADWKSWREGWEPSREKLDSIPDVPREFFSKYLRQQDNIYYGMEQARNALSLKPRGRKS
jgi:Arc-like DNA binding domain